MLAIVSYPTAAEEEQNRENLRDGERKQVAGTKARKGPDGAE